MKVAVLGRGMSILKIKQIKDIDIDTCIIVNRFNKEAHHKDVYSFLKGKNIIHMIAIQSPPCYLPKKVYEDLNIKTCLLNRTKEQLKGKPHPVEPILKKYNIGLNIKYMPDDWKDKMVEATGGARLRSSGLAAICYATQYLDCDELYIIGMDFHETPYYSTNKLWSDRRRVGLSKDMRDGFTAYVKGTPNKRYHIITDSSYRFESNNIEFI